MSKARIDWEALLPQIAVLTARGVSAAEIVRKLKMDCTPHAVRAKIRQYNLATTPPKRRRKTAQADIVSAVDIDGIEDPVQKFNLMTSGYHAREVDGLSGIPVPKDLLLQYLTKMGTPVQETVDGIYYKDALYPCWGLFLAQFNLERAISGGKCIRLTQ